MSFTHGLSTNNYGPAKLIVATSAANGTHTTLASAMAAASAGDTIFLRDSVTENVTITPGVNISSWAGSSLNTPTITGTLTMTGAGTSAISGIKLTTNSAAIIAVTGSAASILNVIGCYLNCSNNTGITYSSSSSSSKVNLYSCNGDLGTTGIALFANSSTGVLNINYSTFTNTGASTTASTTSAAAGLTNMTSCLFTSAFSTASSSAIFFQYCNVNTNSLNTTTVTLAGTGTSTGDCSNFSSGTASTISIGSGTQWNSYGACTYGSTNTNAITGAGTLRYNYISLTNTGVGVNPTTVSPFQGLYAGPSSVAFTPAITFGGAAVGVTYSVQNGYYNVLYQNLVIFGFQLGLSSKGSSVGSAVITGFPFAGSTNSASVANMNFSGYANFTFTAGNINLFMQMNAATTAGIYQCGTGTAVSAVTNTNFANNTVLYCNGHYFTN